TTNTGARANAQSSFSRRWRPVSVLAIVSEARSMATLLHVRELAVADPDPVAVMKRLRPGQQLLVQIGSVSGAEILNHYHLPLTRDAGVARGGERVVEPDLDVPAAQRQAAVRDPVGHPRRLAGDALDQQFWLGVDPGV